MLLLGIERKRESVCVCVREREREREERCFVWLLGSVMELEHWAVRREWRARRVYIEGREGHVLDLWNGDWVDSQ